LSGLAFLFPIGVLFAFPYFIQQLSRRISFMEDVSPLLPVRIAEIILGRLSPMSFAVVAPAHFLGCILGTVVFKTILPFASSESIATISYEPPNLVTILAEVVIVAIYVTATIALPEILSVNKLPPVLLSLLVVPFMCIPLPNIGATFHPAALYALAYTQFGESSSSGIGATQTAHLAAPVVGAILAGWICLKLFPDDPTSWRRR